MTGEQRCGAWRGCGRQRGGLGSALLFCTVVGHCHGRRYVSGRGLYACAFGLGVALWRGRCVCGSVLRRRRGQLHGDVNVRSVTAGGIERERLIECARAVCDALVWRARRTGSSGALVLHPRHRHTGGGVGGDSAFTIAERSGATWDERGVRRRLGNSTAAVEEQGHRRVVRTSHARSWCWLVWVWGRVWVLSDTLLQFVGK